MRARRLGRAARLRRHRARRPHPGQPERRPALQGRAPRRVRARPGRRTGPPAPRRVRAPPGRRRTHRAVPHRRPGRQRRRRHPHPLSASGDRLEHRGQLGSATVTTASGGTLVRRNPAPSPSRSIHTARQPARFAPATSLTRWSPTSTQPLGTHTELALDDLEDALVGLGHPVVLGEDDRLEVAAQPDRLGQPAPVGEQAQPVVGPQRVEARRRCRGRAPGHGRGARSTSRSAPSVSAARPTRPRRRPPPSRRRSSVRANPSTRSRARLYSTPSSSLPTTTAGRARGPPTQRVGERARPGHPQLVERRRSARRA